MRRRASIVLLITLFAAGCGGARGDAARVDVVASLYPLAFVAQRVGGDHVVVRNLTPAGAEPHDLELTPSQVDAVQRTDLVVYLGEGFQPVVAKAAGAARRAFDALRAAGPTIGSDPHVWLDPTRLARIAAAVADELAKIDGGHADTYRERRAELVRELNDLDLAYAQGLRSCARREIVTAHEAFGYLADRYHLRQISIAGVDPEAEPTPRHLKQVVDAVRRHHATTVFSEALLSPKIAQTVSREAHVRTDVLDPIEGVSGGDTYLTVMRRNLDALGRALDCA